MLCCTDNVGWIAISALQLYCVDDFLFEVCICMTKQIICTRRFLLVHSLVFMFHLLIVSTLKLITFPLLYK